MVVLYDGQLSHMIVAWIQKVNGVHPILLSITFQVRMDKQQNRTIFELNFSMSFILGS